MTKRTMGRINDVRAYLDEVFDGGLHAKRVASLANGTLGEVPCWTLFKYRMRGWRCFQLVPVNTVLQQQHIDLTMPTEVFQLFPHLHHTDGFFAAVLQKA